MVLKLVFCLLPAPVRGRRHKRTDRHTDIAQFRLNQPRGQSSKNICLITWVITWFKCNYILLNNNIVFSFAYFYMFIFLIFAQSLFLGISLNPLLQVTTATKENSFVAVNHRNKRKFLCCSEPLQRGRLCWPNNMLF